MPRGARPGWPTDCGRIAGFAGLAGRRAGQGSPPLFPDRPRRPPICGIGGLPGWVPSTQPPFRSDADLAATGSPATRAPAMPPYDLVWVGGVPGAGKTTAIKAGADPVATETIDPEQVAHWLGRRLPRLGYRAYRWVVHTVHTLRVVARLLAGPDHERLVVIHDPGTRILRRRLYAGLARAAGWRAVLLYLDVDRAAAQEGQRRRGRLVRSFDAHWRNWEHQRPALAAGLPDADGEPVLLVGRADAASALRALSAGRRRMPA